MACRTQQSTLTLTNKQHTMSHAISSQDYLALVKELFLYSDRSFGIERKWVDVQVARQIEQVDPSRTIYHVDWSSEISHRPLDKAPHYNIVCVWLAKDWKESYAQYVYEKELSAKERLQSCTVVEVKNRLRKKVVRRLFPTSGINPSNKDVIENMLDKMLSSRSQEAATFFEVSLEELIKIDIELKEFKEQQK